MFPIGFRIQQQSRSEADLCASNDQYADPAVESLSRGLTKGDFGTRITRWTVGFFHWTTSVHFQDIRDLFNLTTSHMSTYMVVGTLFLGYSVSHMWYITTFPADPPWLKFFWMNCFISAMCYGFLAPRMPRITPR